jgi:uncharacterized protein YndB with AHSA1/START domain
MLKVLGIVAGVIVVAVLVVLAIAAGKPSTFQVSRTTLIRAPAEKIFPLIDDLHAWRSWSPYEDKDPNLQRTYAGPEAGVGAHYGWVGDAKKVGTGSMQIIESIPPSKVKLKLDFLVPFEGHNTAEFTLEPEGDATRVTWAMSGPSPLMSKVMGLFFNMDAMIGDDFAVGLARLKAAAEG